MDLKWFFFKCHVNSQLQCLRREKNKVLGVLFWFSRDHKTKLVINHRLRESASEQQREKNKVFVSQAELICRAEVCRFGAQSTPLLQLKPLEIFSQGGQALCEALLSCRGALAGVWSEWNFKMWNLARAERSNAPPHTPLPPPIPSSFSSRSELHTAYNPPCPNDISSSRVVLKYFRLP